MMNSKKPAASRHKKIAAASILSLFALLATAFLFANPNNNSLRLSNTRSPSRIFRYGPKPHLQFENSKYRVV